MKVIETYVAWSNRYQDYVTVYMCQSVNSQEIEYFAQHEGQFWKPLELELKELLKQQ
jgi:hypothetical protein